MRHKLGMVISHVAILSSIQSMAHALSLFLHVHLVAHIRHRPYNRPFAENMTISFSPSFAW